MKMILLGMSFLGWLFLGHCRAMAEGKVKILCTTFPMSQFTANLVAGIESAGVDLLFPARTGCPHDLVVTPRDMARMEGADIIVLNGLGMEPFAEGMIRNIRGRKLVIDASRGLADSMLIPLEDDAHDGHCDASCQSHMNPHVFASPRIAAMMVGNIAADLSAARPEWAGVVNANARLYTGKLMELAAGYADVAALPGKRNAIVPHGVLDYMLRDAGITAVMSYHAHAMESPSAADIIAAVRVIRAGQARVVIAEAGASDSFAKAIIAESDGSGILVFVDSVVSGPSGAAPGYYETIMKRNLDIIRHAFESE